MHLATTTPSAKIHGRLGTSTKITAVPWLPWITGDAFAQAPRSSSTRRIWQANAAGTFFVPRASMLTRWLAASAE